MCAYVIAHVSLTLTPCTSCLVPSARSKQSDIAAQQESLRDINAQLQAARDQLRAMDESTRSAYRALEIASEEKIARETAKMETRFAACTADLQTADQKLRAFGAKLESMGVETESLRKFEEVASVADTAANQQMLAEIQEAVAATVRASEARREQMGATLTRLQFMRENLRAENDLLVASLAC